MPNPRILLTSLALALLSLSHIAIAVNENDSPVLAIAGNDELAAAATAHPYLAVEFYVPWCDHCKALAPEWSKAASDLKKKGSKVVLATVNGEEQPNFALNSKYKMESFPTIKVFQYGDIEHPFNYTGPRTSQGIVHYLEQHAEAAPIELTSKKDAENFLHQNEKKPTIIAFLGSQQSAHAAARKFAYFHMADKLLGEVVAAYVTDPSLLEEKNSAKCSPREENKNEDCDSPVAIMTKPNEKDKKQPRYQGDFTSELLIQWAASHATPLVARYFKNDPESLQDFARAFQVPLPQVVIAFERARDINQAAYDAVSAAAEANDDLKFTVTAHDQGEQLLKSFGVAVDAPTPLFVIYDALKNEKYLKTAIKLENLPEFVEEYKVGALTPFKGSALKDTIDAAASAKEESSTSNSHEEL